MLARTALSNIARRAVQAARPVAGELRENMRSYPSLSAAKGAGGGVRTLPKGQDSSCLHHQSLGASIL